MSMTKIPKFPRKMEELLGLDGKDDFIDFLNESFHHQEESVVQFVSDRFDLRVTEGVGKVNQSIDRLDNRVTEEIGKVNQSIARLDNRITEEISGVRVQIAELRSEIKADIADIHRCITSQTKWILTVVLAAAALISILQPLMQKILKIG